MLKDLLVQETLKSQEKLKKDTKAYFDRHLSKWQNKLFKEAANGTFNTSIDVDIVEI